MDRQGRGPAARRALLREAGIEPATRFAQELAQARGESTDAIAKKRNAIVWRVRIFLLAVIAVLILLNALNVLHLF